MVSTSFKGTTTARSKKRSSTASRTLDGSSLLAPKQHRNCGAVEPSRTCNKLFKTALLALKISSRKAIRAVERKPASRRLYSPVPVSLTTSRGPRSSSGMLNLLKRTEKKGRIFFSAKRVRKKKKKKKKKNQPCSRSDAAFSSLTRVDKEIVPSSILSLSHESKRVSQSCSSGTIFFNSFFSSDSPFCSPFSSGPVAPVLPLVPLFPFSSGKIFCNTSFQLVPSSPDFWSENASSQTALASMLLAVPGVPRSSACSPDTSASNKTITAS